MKKISVVLLLLVCLVSGVFAQKITGSFLMFDQSFYQDYDYEDGYFFKDPAVYNHDLARLTLGMALSASRNTNNKEAQDCDLIDFFNAIGFENIETEPFRTEPTADSIAYGLAMKQTGDSTILACAICGGGYGAEWASNLTVGDYERSYGFNDASMKVQAAIKKYLNDHQITGSVKLWITGYSRAGAVSNITAADLTDAGLFDAIYAYTFATPLTTRKPGNYTGIFNIIQKEDPVPKVPLADWGYKRYGKDLRLVSSETDSESQTILDRAAKLYRDMTGSEMVFNSEINFQLRTILDYLLTLMPDSATYTQYLQPLIVDIMTSSDGTVDALQVLLEALMQYSTDDPVAAEELKALREYLGTMIEVYVLQNGISNLPEEKWNPEIGILNLFNAHLPAEYLALMFASDNPSDIFTDNTKYVRIVVYGDVDLTVRDNNNAVYMPYTDKYDDKVIVTLPSDKNYKIIVTSKAKLIQTVSYTGLQFSGDTVRAKSDNLYSLLMDKGDMAEIVVTTGENVIDPDHSDYADILFFTDLIYSPTTAMRLENNNVVHLTISGLVNRLLLIIVILLVQMIASIVLAIIRKKKGRKRNEVVALIWHGIIAFIFALLEVSMWYFAPVLTIAKMIPGVLVFTVILIYGIKGCRAGSRKWKAFAIINISLAVYEILESMIIGNFTVLKAVLLLVVYALFMAVSFVCLWKSDKQEIKGE